MGSTDIPASQSAEGPLVYKWGDRSSCKPWMPSGGVTLLVTKVAKILICRCDILCCKRPTGLQEAAVEHLIREQNPLFKESCSQRTKLNRDLKYLVDHDKNIPRSASYNIRNVFH